MQADPQHAAVSKKMLWAGRIVSALVVLMLIFSGGMKLAKPEDVVKEFARLGYGEHLIIGIGILEIVCALMYAIPRTSVLGAILVTGYLGGATATHVRIDDWGHFIFPVIGGMLAWLGLYLRRPCIRALIPLRR